MDDLVQALALSKSTIRAHLLRLEEAGQVERRTLVHDGPGRPGLAFTLSDAGHGRFPNQEGAILHDLLRFLIDRGDVDRIQAYFTTLWADRRAELERRLGRPLRDVPLRERRAAVLELLEESGFMPSMAVSTDGEEGEFRLRECNCPFPEAVRATRIPCRLERAFLEHALGRIITSSTIATTPGKDTCTFVFEHEDDGVGSFHND